MADPISHLEAHEFPSKELRHSISRGQPKSTHENKPKSFLFRILRKSLLFLLFLVAIPLFPSQAPNFISRSLLTKFWELVHLLFVGLVVSYGLFCRRNVEVEFEPSSNLDETQSSLVSRIFHVCPFFEDGYEISSGVDEKIMPQTLNVQDNEYRDHNFENVSSGRFVRCELEGIYKDISLESEGDFNTSFEYGETNEVQAWNSQYLQGASVAVMSNASHELDGYGCCGPVASNESLGLPVRSLNLGMVNPGSPLFSNGERSNPSLMEGSRGNSNSESAKEFGDMGPTNLGGKFHKTSVSSPQVPWYFMLERVDLGVEEGSGKSISSNFIPLSVEETQIESFESQSFHSTTSSLSQARSMSGSPRRLSHSSSVSSEASSEAEEAEKSKSLRASYPPTSQSPLKTLNGEAPLNAFHLRRYSSGSLFSKNSEASSRDKLKGLRWSRREDLLSSKQREHGSEKLDKKNEAPVKASSRGKSVRTIRSNRYAEDGLEGGDVIESQTYYELERNSVEAKAVKLDEMKSEGNAYLSTEDTKRNVDSRREVTKPACEEYHKKGKEEYDVNAIVDPEEDSRSETENFQVTSDRNGVTNIVRDEGYESSEVDRKAGEFIAKFKEQIRLQKVASMNRSRGIHMVRNHLK